MADAVIIGPGGGEELTVRGGSILLFKAVAATTGGAFSLHERRVPAGGRKRTSEKMDAINNRKNGGHMK